MTHHLAAVGEPHRAFGLALAATFVILNVLRGDYATASYLDAARHPGRVALAWTIAVVLTFVPLFVAGEAILPSPPAMLLLYLGGAAAIGASRAVLSRHLARLVGAGRLQLFRIFITGEEGELRRFHERYEAAAGGIDIVASVVLRGQATLKEDLSLAAAIARIVRPDEIFILSAWTRPEVVDAAIAAFMRVPAALHLGPPPGLDRFDKMRISRIGPITSVNIVRRPIAEAEQFAKRAMDLAVAPLLLLLFSPLLLLAALAIKLESRGPALFVQRRGGFNQQSFRLYKLRTMGVAEDGKSIRQAVRGDARVTRVGSLLRRTSIDELPQLWNVIRGDMSLVGPRPHAVAHDQLYARIIGDYARRHNVKPGLTGWAQIHGLRGATTDAAMGARIAHDLHYIDNWSLWMDLCILTRTLLSPQAFRNAR